MFEAIGLTVITDPKEVKRYSAMRRVRCNYESSDGKYVGHLMPARTGGWAWSVRQHDNFDKPVEAEGVQQTSDEATMAMTDSLRALSGDEDAAWR